MTHPGFQSVTIEHVDRAIRDWFDKTVDARVKAPEGLKKVPVVFSQGERWAAGRSRKSLRDENGVLILPVISLRRISVEPNPEMTALGAQASNITIAKRLDPKTNDVRNLGYRGSVYEIYTIPFPTGAIAMYELVIQAQYITQMNEIIQKIWKLIDIWSQFAAPLFNDGKHQTPRLDQYKLDQLPINFPYVVGFFESAANDSGNFEEFTDQERIIKYSTEIKVPFVLLGDAEGLEPSIKVERTAFKLRLRDEQFYFADDASTLEDVFERGTIPQELWRQQNSLAQQTEMPHVTSLADFTSDEPIMVVGTAPAGSIVRVKVDGVTNEIWPLPVGESSFSIPLDDVIPGRRSVLVTAQAADQRESRPDTYSILVDRAAPVITKFLSVDTWPDEWNIPITLVATDDQGVAGYLVKVNDSTVPSVSDHRWTRDPPTIINAVQKGPNIFSAWAIDFAGNISDRAEAGTVVWSSPAP